jgi:uncharacterized membrane protein required for colicin V production
MSVVLTLLMIVILAACVGVLYPEGLWSNLIRLVNVVTAALIAMNFWEPLARKLEGMGDWFASITYFLDFLTLWMLFGVTILVMRIATDMISPVKVRFLKVVDRAGGAFFGFCVGWVMVCFILTTLHAAPLGPVSFGGGFDPSKKMFLGLGPDRQWLGFVQYESKGPLACSEPAVFDANNKFMEIYNNRRGALETQRTEKKAFRVGSGEAPKR